MHCGYQYNLGKFCSPKGFTLAANRELATWCVCADGARDCYCAKAGAFSAKPPRYTESVLGEMQPEAPRITSQSSDIKCDNSDERPSEMSWQQIQHGALSAMMQWGVEYARNNYADEVLMKEASQDLAKYERKMRQSLEAKEAKAKGGKN